MALFEEHLLSSFPCLSRVSVRPLGLFLEPFEAVSKQVQRDPPPPPQKKTKKANPGRLLWLPPKKALNWKGTSGVRKSGTLRVSVWGTCKHGSGGCRCTTKS